ncbi:Hypothetical predicted protein [Octopus vulgaris]|uniref:Uncharacterized protein n=1 Tax=Octopus vulgaris TaxID=6645 RepID=A0AA36FIG1_OCTVU|nr:Hypothetical predicted protein [Octopus vulgaris]
MEKREAIGQCFKDQQVVGFECFDLKSSSPCSSTISFQFMPTWYCCLDMKCHCYVQIDVASVRQQRGALNPTKRMRREVHRTNHNDRNKRTADVASIRQQRGASVVLSNMTKRASCSKDVASIRQQRGASVVLSNMTKRYGCSYGYCRNYAPYISCCADVASIRQQRGASVGLSNMTKRMRREVHRTNQNDRNKRNDTTYNAGSLAQWIVVAEFCQSFAAAHKWHVFALYRVAGVEHKIKAAPLIIVYSKV